MVRFDEETSNALFDVLSDWESLLKAENFDIPKILNEAESNLEKEPLPDKEAPQGELAKAFEPEKTETKPKSSPAKKLSRRPRGPSR